MERIPLTKPAAGDAVNVLWRHVVRLADVVAAQQQELTRLGGRLPRRRPMDVKGGGGWNFTGLYDPHAAYEVDDVVKHVGAGMGTYLCQVAHTPVEDPSTHVWSEIHYPYLGEFSTEAGKQFWALLIASGEGCWA